MIISFNLTKARKSIKSPEKAFLTVNFSKSILYKDVILFIISLSFLKILIC